ARARAAECARLFSMGRIPVGFIGDETFRAAMARVMEDVQGGILVFDRNYWASRLVSEFDPRQLSRWRMALTAAGISGFVRALTTLPSNLLPSWLLEMAEAFNRVRLAPEGVAENGLSWGINATHVALAWWTNLWAELAAPGVMAADPPAMLRAALPEQVSSKATDLYAAVLGKEAIAAALQRAEPAHAAWGSGLQSGR